MPHLTLAKITELFQRANNVKNKTRRDETLIEIRVVLSDIENKYMNAKAYSPFHGGRPMEFRSQALRFVSALAPPLLISHYNSRLLIIGESRSSTRRLEKHTILSTLVGKQTSLKH